MPPRLVQGLTGEARAQVERWWARLDDGARREFATMSAACDEDEVDDEVVDEGANRGAGEPAAGGVAPTCITPAGLADQVEGGLLGLLVGDALGVPYEFHGPRELPPRAAIEFTPPAGFRRAHDGVPPGTWSDDGAQALCLLASLLARGELDLDDLGARLLRWWEDGYLAVDGRVFDIGVQTREALTELSLGTPASRSGPADEHANGNGALMRVLPLALWHRGDDAALFDDATRSSLPTHGHARSQLCCGLYCLFARRLLEGAETGAAWSEATRQGAELWARRGGAPAELRAVDPARAPAGGGGGYVVDSLHSARLALESGPYEHVVKAAVALGHDTDTTAAIAGGLAGVREGALAIPDRWVRALRGRALLDPLLDRLLDVRAG